VFYIPAKCLLTRPKALEQVFTLAIVLCLTNLFTSNSFHEYRYIIKYWIEILRIYRNKYIITVLLIKMNFGINEHYLKVLQWASFNNWYKNRNISFWYSNKILLENKNLIKFHGIAWAFWWCITLFCSITVYFLLFK
jgi:hypothetical protein